VDLLDLADYRERVARMYVADTDLAAFRRTRDGLFASHPQSAIPAEDRAAFTGLRYFPENPDARATVSIEPPVAGQDDAGIDIDTGGPDGVIHYRRVGILGTPWGPLTLWWLDAYGGGLFLPLRDGTCGTTGNLGPEHSYGGGRYVTDTVKGTFGRGLTVESDGRVTIDVNYAYNPSCAYDDRWACPLAPPENRVTAPIRAGEMAYHL
jgi:uncharacterized protein (DUF1684 family)